MTTYKGINHIAFATNDMDKTIRFWRDLLGLRLIAGHGGPGHRQYFFMIAEKCYISFFEWPDVKPVDDKDPGRPYKGPLSFDHICISIAHEGELWALKDRLEAADIWVTEVLDHGFIHSFFSTDPNNIQLEFCHELSDIELGETPRMVDTEPTNAAIEGPEPRSDLWPSVKNATPPDQRKTYEGPLKVIFTGNNKWQDTS